ncbi:MAG: CinA family protein [Erysipelotrichales bacterium]|nr:CinA family protein [Erysipelotrichales bacterium]
MNELATLLKERDISIASVESFTVGAFANAIGSISGISQVYRGSLVSYQTRIKRDVLKINQDIIDTYGVVSNEIAGLMAINGKELFSSDLCISFTGNAGPTAMEGKPVGLIYIGIAYMNDIYTYCFELSGSREDIKKQAVMFGVEKILDILK